MIAKAIRAATPTMRDMAEWLDVSYHTLRSWRLGVRTAPPEARRKLAVALRQQARRLLALAERLDRSAEREP